MFESFKYNDNEFKQKLFLFLLFDMFMITGQELLLYRINMSLISFLNIYESDILGLLATLGLIIVNIAFVVNFMPNKREVIKK
jgi:hypothetical protein